MEIRYRYQIEDFVELAKEFDRIHPQSRRLRRFYIYIGMVVLLVPFLESGSFTQPAHSLWWSAPIGALLICTGWYSIKKLVRAHYAESIHDYDYTATISDSGIVTISPTVRTELQWSAFSASYRTQNLLTLVHDSVMYLFPRRAFSAVQVVGI